MGVENEERMINRMQIEKVLLFQDNGIWTLSLGDGDSLSTICMIQCTDWFAATKRSKNIVTEYNRKYFSQIQIQVGSSRWVQLDAG